ncbi:MAG: DNA gyrase inhibitor YacG [Pseudomonadota bacterium]
MKSEHTTRVKCPQCGTSVSWIASEKFRPFCSERCKLIDFGGWAAGERAIPGETVTLEPDASLTVEQLLENSDNPQKFD